MSLPSFKYAHKCIAPKRLPKSFNSLLTRISLSEKDISRTLSATLQQPVYYATNHGPSVLCTNIMPRLTNEIMIYSWIISLQLKTLLLTTKCCRTKGVEMSYRTNFLHVGSKLKKFVLVQLKNKTPTT